RPENPIRNVRIAPARKRNIMAKSQSPHPGKTTRGSSSEQRGKTAGATVRQGELPSREAVLQAVADFPELSSKREIARHFGIRGDDRIALKKLLRELEGEGLLARRR